MNPVSPGVLRLTGSADGAAPTQSQPVAEPMPPEASGEAASRPGSRGDRVNISPAALRRSRAEGPQTLPPQASPVARERLAERFDGGFQISAEASGPAGRSRSVSLTVDTETQTASLDRSFTSAEGEEVNISGEVTLTEEGYERTRTRTGADGESVTRDVSGSLDMESGSFSRVVTLDAGAYELTRSLDISWGEDGFSLSRQFALSIDGAPADDVEAGTGGEDLTVQDPPTDAVDEDVAAG